MTVVRFPPGTSYREEKMRKKEKGKNCENFKIKHGKLNIFVEKKDGKIKTMKNGEQ